MWLQPFISDAAEESVLAAIKADRQNVQAAKAAWETSSGKDVNRVIFQRFFLKLGRRYKRIRKRLEEKPEEHLYEYKLEKLLKLEKLATNGKINLYYDNESHVCMEGYVPYGWKFPNEEICILSEKSTCLNRFVMINSQRLGDSCL